MGSRARASGHGTMTFLRQDSLQNDSVSSTSDTSLYVETGTYSSTSIGFVTSSSEISSSSSESSTSKCESTSLACQLKESPWVTSTTSTEEDPNLYQTSFCGARKIV